MRILLTGASSFTGFWFAKALSDAGHQVTTPLRGRRENYQDATNRAERVHRLASFADIVWDCSFGLARFLELVQSQSFDVFGHHAARVEDYRSPDFGIEAALAENTKNLRTVLAILAERGLVGVVLTGSVFEQDEGAGNAPLVAFSPYGLSKGLTFQVFRLRCYEIGMPLGKFVIPNPFGPLEEPRFCAYLMRTWKAGLIARIETPCYIRDNIHVDLLAAAYRRFVEETTGGDAFRHLNPSGYVEAQGSFAERCARAMGRRLGALCGLELLRQTDFKEPIMRVNTDPAIRYVHGWDEEAAWDALAEAYRDQKN